MEKLERIDRVRNGIHDSGELLRRMPEISMIESEAIRHRLIDYFLDFCPKYFWERPASSSGKYHPPDESDEYGTWIHTKRVFAEYEHVSESWVEQGLLSPEQREQGMAAALIHDTFNYGWPSENRAHTKDSHDEIAAAVAQYVGLPEETVNLVETHMGPWTEARNPETFHERVFHQCDNSSAKRGHTPSIHMPCEELQEIETINSIENETQND